MAGGDPKGYAPHERPTCSCGKFADVTVGGRHYCAGCSPNHPKNQKKE